MKSVEIIAQYDYHKRDFYTRLANAAKSSMEALLNRNNIKYHQITARAKDITSLEKKVTSKREKYTSLEEITDLAGIRVILYFEDEINAVSNLIRTDNEFSINTGHTRDNTDLDINQFGYRSLHYIVNLNIDYSPIFLDRQLRNGKVEVQIRTILNHSWAEINHDTGYKTTTILPETLKRKMFRIAALLELADQEFVEFRKGIVDYNNSIAAQNELPQEEIEITKETLRIYLNSPNALTILEEKICLENHCNLDTSELSSDCLKEANLVFLKYFGVNNLGDLNREITQAEDSLKNSFVEEYGSDVPNERKFARDLTRGFLIYYLLQHLNKQQTENFQKKK